MLKMGIMFGLIGAAAISAAAAGQQQTGLPNSFLTPGNTRKVTKEQVCAADYATAMKPLTPSSMISRFESTGVATTGRPRLMNWISLKKNFQGVHSFGLTGTTPSATSYA